MRVVRDPSWRDVDDDTVLAGSPLRLLRLTARGRDVLAHAEAAIDEPTPTESRFLDRLIAAGAVHPVGGRGPYSGADVTVVMPVRGAWPTLPEAERVVVVDDASDEPLVAPPDVAAELIRLEQNVGPGGARSAGLETVTTPLVAFVDADVELPAGWLDDLLCHFADDRVALVAPRVTSREGDSVLARYESTHSPLDLGGDPALVAPGSRVSYVPSAAVVVRVDALRSVGGFDHELRYGEDVDLVWRLVEAGWRVRYEPRVVARHAPRSSWPEWWRQRVGYGSSAAPLAVRHGDAVAPVRCNGWSLAVWALLLARRRTTTVVALTVAAATGVMLERRLPRLPRREAWRLVARGHALAGLQVARAARRVWWPLALVALLLGRRARLTVALLTLAPTLVGARSATKEHGGTTAARHAAIGFVDDLAYGVGVWKGILTTRDWRALVPKVSGWPPPDGD